MLIWKQTPFLSFFCEKFFGTNWNRNCFSLFYFFRVLNNQPNIEIAFYVCVAVGPNIFSPKSSLTFWGRVCASQPGFESEQDQRNFSDKFVSEKLLPYLLTLQPNLKLIDLKFKTYSCDSLRGYCQQIMSCVLQIIFRKYSCMFKKSKLSHRWLRKKLRS